MIALVVLAAILMGLAYRLRHNIRTERLNGCRQALAIGAILLLIYAARAVFGGPAGTDCDIGTAVPKDVTVP